MGKVFFDPGIDSVRGILIGTDPFYIRRKDLSKIAADQAAFQAQKDTAGGKKTMYAFLWKLEGEAYDQAHPRS